jgi:ABC-2 type transport system ATP-binding protein
VVTPGEESAVLHLHLDKEPAIGAVVQTLVGAGSHILTLQRIEPTLEDVFIQLVGHGLSESEATP